MCDEGGRVSGRACCWLLHPGRGGPEWLGCGKHAEQLLSWGGWKSTRTRACVCVCDCVCGLVGGWSMTATQPLRAGVWHRAPPEVWWPG